MSFGIRRFAACAAIAIAGCLAGSDPARGHAFPVHATPGAGAVLGAAPPSVSITFDDMLEPIFSSVRVEDANGREVAKAPAAADRPDAAVLEVKLPSLGPGVYHVWWSAVARDGHRTVGDYTFTVK